MGVIQLCTCKITHLIRVIISERKGKITHDASSMGNINSSVKLQSLT